MIDFQAACSLGKKEIHNELLFFIFERKNG